VRTRLQRRRDRGRRALCLGDGRLGQHRLGAVLHQHQPARAGGLELFANQRICLAAAVFCHLAVVAEDGAVYTCSAGLNGRLELGDGQPRRRLTRVPQAVFAGSRVIMVACGREHTMAGTAAGHAWTCGSNDYGQLGVGLAANRLGFTQVDAEQLGSARIVMAACGAIHSLVVSAEGHVWTFGCGDFGCLGLNDEQDRLVPTLLAAEVFEGSKIVTVAAGGYHNMAVGESGALWAWGKGYSGQMGLGDINDRRVPTLVGAEEVFGGSKVRTIACGYFHTLVVTEAGELGRRTSGEFWDQGDSAARRVIRPLDEDHLRCLDDHHVCSQVRGKKWTLKVLFFPRTCEQSKSPLVRRTYHERLLDGHHVC
jgi:alpha-tubulin suppressor-like RCC1 family protein